MTNYGNPKKIRAAIVGAVSSILEVEPATEAELAETGKSVEKTGKRWLATKLGQHDIEAVRGTAVGT